MLEVFFLSWRRRQVCDLGSAYGDFIQFSHFLSTLIWLCAIFSIISIWASKAKQRNVALFTIKAKINGCSFVLISFLFFFSRLAQLLTVNSEPPVCVIINRLNTSITPRRQCTCQRAEGIIKKVKIKSKHAGGERFWVNIADNNELNGGKRGVCVVWFGTCRDSSKNMKDFTASCFHFWLGKITHKCAE